MTRILKKIKDKIKKIKRKVNDKKKTLKDILINTIVSFFYYRMSINEKLIYIESQSGGALNGNMLRICEELNKDEYNGYKVVVRAKKNSRQKIEKLLKTYRLKNVKIIDRRILSLFYMEQAKYIFLDAGVQYKYVKKEGQIFINTWHGTPFKTMGKENFAERHRLGNIQRNFLMCDYFLFPNRYMQEIFLRDYMIENLWKGKSLLTGYPRNAVFFDADRRNHVKKQLGLDGKQVFAYLPTHRGILFAKKNAEQCDRVIAYLDELDKKLTDDQVLLLKFHLYNKKKVDCSQYKHIINFPEGYETYDVLNSVDCLITDYSSVFFDFAVTRKKIVLFAYDEEEYFADRGVYFPFAELPFPKVTNIDELVYELNRGIEYDDSAFLAKFAPYESADATVNLCRHIIKKEKVCIEEPAPYNGKENVLIHVGGLAKNGITSAMVNLLQTIDSDKRNYFATFLRPIVKTADKTSIIPEHIPYIAINESPCFTIWEAIAYLKLLRLGKVKYQLSSVLKKMYDRELKKHYWNADFQHVMDFNGYTKHPMMMLSRYEARKSIWVHSNMVNEVMIKGNQSYAMLSYLYNIYDNVAVVSEGFIEPTVKISEKNNNVKVVRNCFDFKGAIKKGDSEISFDKDTICVTENPEGIHGVLNCDGHKFITVGRFSPEKGHIRLMNAFEKYWQDNKQTQLIIIGGYGPWYKKTVSYAQTLECYKNITIIKSIRNPMPILKRCDLFLLSSDYEGLSVVLFEAGCFNLPCISTDIEGLRDFMVENKGFLVEHSEEGLLNGMRAFAEGKLVPIEIDYEKFNQKCLAQFESLF